MKKLYIIAILVLALGLSACTAPDEPLGAVNELSNYGINSQATSTTLVAGVGKKVLDEQSGRKYAIIMNTGSTEAYLSLYQSATTTAGYAAIADSEYAIRINANGGAYEINLDNLYTGQIVASSSGATTIRALQIY